MHPPSLPLAAYVQWLYDQGCADATVIVYVARARATLRRLGCPDDDLSSLAAHAGREADIVEYFATLSPSTAVQARTAWRMFAIFLESRGVEAAQLPRSGSQRGILRPPSLRPSINGVPIDSLIPEDVRWAMWSLFKRDKGTTTPLDPSFVRGLTWARAWRNGGNPFSAVQAVLFNPDHAVFMHYYYKEPITEWKILWLWACGNSRLHPDPNQPFLVTARGSMERVSGDLLLKVISMGDKGSFAVPAPPSLDGVRFEDMPISPPFEDEPSYAPPPVMRQEPPSVRQDAASAPQAPPPAPPEPEVVEDPLEAWDAPAVPATPTEGA